MIKVVNAIFFSAIALFNNFATGGELASTRFIWDGELTLEKLRSFNERVKISPTLTSIEFTRSPGAGSDGGTIINEINKQIESQKLKTFARGQCASACASTFLLGEERTLLPSLNNVPTHLMIHAMRSNKTGEIDYGGTDRILKKIIAKSNGKITMKFLEKIYDAKTPEGGLFILRDATLTADGSKQNVFFCDGEERTSKRPCQPYKNVRLQDLGISVKEE